VARLSVNIDHVATVRQARRSDAPDPIIAAHEAECGGADGITVHLREDRRHIQDADVLRLRRELRVPLNFEMAATEEMVAFACDLRPASAMLVPEGRAEITTEGGLDVVRDRTTVARAISRLASAGIDASVFVDADETQVRAAAAVGAAICEIHTGPYAHAVAHEGGLGSAARAELAKVQAAGALAESLGMRFNAGHALNEANARAVAQLRGVHELHIGHAIVSQAVFFGIREAVARMKRLIER
jgi:pyridoxine 5-phosphate synthase